MKSWERVMLYTLFAGMVATTLVGAKTRTQKLVRAERIELVDAYERTRIVFQVQENGDVGINMTGPQGSVSLGVGNQGTGMAVLVGEAVRVTLGADPMGNAGLSLYSPSVQPLVSLGVSAMGDPTVSVVDSSGTPLLTVPEQK